MGNDDQERKVNAQSEKDDKHNSLGEINTGGGIYAGGDVITSGGDFIGRDKTIHGDAVGGDKALRDSYRISAERVEIHQYLKGKAPQPVDEKPAPGESPYKGLQFFDVSDVGLFFGREQLAAELVDRLRQQRFLAVVGASGSGKSSLVRAGLVPALTKGEPLADGTLPPGGYQAKHVHIITPTALPLEKLASSLTRASESVTAATTLIDDLAHDPRSLRIYVHRLLEGGASTDRFLLIVDQFEELFTLCRDPAQRKALIDNLLMAVSEEGQIVVVVTLRADFYVQCAEFDNLRQALERYQKYIGPMSQAEVRRAIEEPAQQAGWALEPGLVDLILADIGNEPGALPLLSHALLETWQRRRGRSLTLAGYTASGRVQGAIAKTAESVLRDHLPTPEQQRLTRNIFLRLTELGESTQDTRRRVALAELIPNPEDKPDVETVLRILADARLVTTFQAEAEVAHEALIREWPRLRTWLSEDREWLRLQRRLTESAKEWEARGRHPDFLYRRALLEMTLDKAKNYKNELTPLERSFLETSQKAKKVVELENKYSQQRRMFVLVVANMVGVFVGIFVGNGVIGTVVLAVAGAGAGAIVGATQWFFLRRSISSAKWWIVANTLGGAIGWAVGNTVDNIIVNTVVWAVPGAIVGATQWAFLCRAISNAKWWIIANTLSGTVAGATGNIVWGIIAPETGNIVAGAVGGAVAGAIVGISQWFFLRRALS